MPEEVRLWKIEAGDNLREISRSRLDLEARLEAWLERDVSTLDPGLLVIGRQVETDFGGLIDILCIDQSGDVVVVELKRDKTPREITAQTLDYGSWVKDLSNERITAIAEDYLGRGKFEEAFTRRFSTELPEILNENHRLLIVASEIDASSERIIKYLSYTYGVNINAATFQYFKATDGSELLARVFLLEPAQVELQSRAKGSSKRRPNLNYHELETIAEEKGVGGLYRRAVAGFERYLQKHTTRTSIGFAGSFNGSRKNVISLIPQESSDTDGLRFQLYLLRLRTLFNLSEEVSLSILPPRRKPWIYYETAGPDYEGFQGFFANDDEIDRFLKGLANSPKVATPNKRIKTDAESSRGSSS
jgi:Endonuclease NucS